MDYPHRRYNSLTGEWVLNSPHRTKRPWQGKVETIAPACRPEYDPGCYLCAGNERAGGHRNPQYERTYVFENDFAALLPSLAADDPPPAPSSQPASDLSSRTAGALLESRPVCGECRVICFSPRHDLTLARMEPKAIRGVVDTWAEQSEELGSRYTWVQVFENKGDIMGCSNPHPHGQIWAGDFIPNEGLKEDAAQRRWHGERGSVLLLDYAEAESSRQERVVVENKHWIAVVPWWAVWPYEVLLVPRTRQIVSLSGLLDDERNCLAEIMKRLLTRYDNLFETSFPYSMGWHQAPFVPGAAVHWQLHAHFYPPLLRSAAVKKFMVGYEMLGEAQRDISPETAAAHLRGCSELHYLDSHT